MKKPNNSFVYLITQFQQSAMQIDGAKILARGSAVKAQHAKRYVYHSHQKFDHYTSAALDGEIECDELDPIPDQSQLDVYFSSIDIKNCNVYTLQAYAANQQQCQSLIPCLFDSKTMIPKDMFHSATK